MHRPDSKYSASANDGPEPQFSLSVNSHDWDQYVDRHESATIYHKQVWRDIISETFGKTSYYVSALRPDGSVSGVLPLVRLRSRFFGDNLVSLPYCNYGGPIADNDAIRLALMEHAAGISNEIGCDSVQIRNHLPLEHCDWFERSDKVRMLLNLPATIADLSQSIGSKRRTQINRPRHENPRIQTGTRDVLDDFYAVFCENMRDLGTPVYPRSFFENILVEIGDHCRIFVIHVNREPVAAAFLIGYRNSMEIPWASSLRRYSRIAVNMLLYWEVLAFAIREGYQIFDFGRCTVGEGTFQFKKQWGSEPHQLYWQQYPNVPTQPYGSIGPGPIMQAARRFWTKLPLPIANRLGPMITSNLPW